MQCLTALPCAVAAADVPQLLLLVVQLSAEQGRVSQLQAEAAAGRTELDNLQATVAELRQKLDGTQMAQVGR